MTIASIQRSGRAELRLGAVLLALTAAGWALSADRMAGMDAAPGAQLGGIDWFALTWLVMMLPVLAPMVVELARRATDARPALRFSPPATWRAGWRRVCSATRPSRACARWTRGFLAWGDAGRYVAAGAIAAAGLYQLSAPKDACLRRCRERTAFRCDRWRRRRVSPR